MGQDISDYGAKVITSGLLLGPFCKILMGKLTIVHLNIGMLIQAFGNKILIPALLVEELKKILLSLLPVVPSTR
jgi:hypothetical protein